MAGRKGYGKTTFLPVWFNLYLFPNVDVIFPIEHRLSHDNMNGIIYMHTLRLLSL